ncbi:MAG: alpha/beta fold hydrolase [Actinobacteria bacterium]|nr:alpha/beta fold hydrolase [Actinomycetota bacterium]
MSVDTHFRIDGGGTRTPLVLLHGAGLDLTMWDRVVAALAADRKVVRFDLLGHGQTVDPPGGRSIEEYVAQLLGVVEATGAGRPDLAGLSMGGMVALGTAARHPESFRRVALLNTVFDRTPEQKAGNRERLAATEAGGMAAVADLAIDRWFTPDWQAAHPVDADAVRNKLLANDPAAYLKAYGLFIEGDPIMPGGAGAITVPTLVMTGELDSGSTPAMTRSLAARVADGQAVVLPGLHHLPPIEAPEAFALNLLDFLDSPDKETLQ